MADTDVVIVTADVVTALWQGRDSVPDSAIPVGSEIEIVAAGTVLPGMIRLAPGQFTAPPPVIPLDSRLVELRQIRLRRETQGVRLVIGQPSRSVIFGTDQLTQSRITGAAVLAGQGGWIDGTAWRLPDGTWLPMAGADVIAASVAVGRHLAAVFAVAQAHEAALADNLSHDITTGWPETP